MVKNHALHTFKPNYLLDYKLLNTLNDSTSFAKGAKWERKKNKYKYC